MTELEQLKRRQPSSGNKGGGTPSQGADGDVGAVDKASGGGDNGKVQSLLGVRYVVDLSSYV